MRALASDSLVKNEPEQGYVMAEQNAYQIADWNGQTGERWVANLGAGRRSATTTSAPCRHPRALAASRLSRPERDHLAEASAQRPLRRRRWRRLRQARAT